MRPRSETAIHTLATGSAMTGAGGDVNLLVGSGDTENGGAVVIKAGESHADSKKGGGVFITSGAGTSAQEGSGGELVMMAGNAEGSRLATEAELKSEVARPLVAGVATWRCLVATATGRRRRADPAGRLVRNRHRRRRDRRRGRERHPRGVQGGHDALLPQVHPTSGLDAADPRLCAQMFLVI